MKLAEVVTGLAQLQKKSLKQDAENVQRRIEDRKPINFTDNKMFKRLGTVNKNGMSPRIAMLAKEMLGTKKKDIAHNLIILSPNNKNMCCKVTPQLM